MEARRRSFEWLLLPALALLVAFLFFGFVYPQVPVRMEAPTASLIHDLGLWRSVVAWGLPVPRSQSDVALTLLLFALLAFGAYGAALFIAWRQRQERRTLVLAIGASVAFFVIAAWSLPNYNSDIYNYIATGRISAAHHANPYTVAADRFPHDSIYPYANHAFTHVAGDRKLAAWTLIATGLAKVAGGGVVESVQVFRMGFLLFNCACLALLVIALRALAPERVLAGTICYGWNPVVAIGGQSKVDTVMVFFLLLGTLLLLRCRRRPAAVALALSAMVKLITLPLIAVWWLRELRLRGVREVAILSALLLATAAVVSAPFWHGPDLIRQQVDLISAEASSIPTLLKDVLTVAFVALVLWVGVTRRGSERQLMWGWAIVALYFAAFLTRIGYAWYLMTMIAVVSLAMDWRLVIAAGALSLAAFYLNAWDNASSGSFPLLGASHISTVVLYLAPVLLAVLAILFVRHRQQSRQAAR